MKLSNSFKKLLVASVVVVLLFVVGLFFWNLRFHITGTNPPLSSVDFVIPYIDVTFNKSLDPKSAVVNSSSPVKAYAVVGSKDLRIYLQAPMTANKSYTLLIKSIESSGNSLLINQKLTFVARNVDFNQLTPAEQKEIINEQSQFPPSMEDPILSHLPYGTLDYNLTDSYQTVGGKTKLILDAQLFLDALDVSSPQAEQSAISSYEQEVAQYISSLGLNPSSYDIQYTIVQPSG
ncbi:MAG TPA: hypothetical protein VMQ52_02615 [Candidatus Saccharimonadales bacterium]|jgi:hypothetical protein|nr:hypothetical protein [Candidatus Saccharimonadales bacterium]